MRQKGDLEPPAQERRPGGLQARSGSREGQERGDPGRLRHPGDKAVFRKVETGITGATDIEVLSGLKEGEEIITGSYKAIRTLRNESRIRVDNQPVAKAE